MTGSVDGEKEQDEEEQERGGIKDTCEGEKTCPSASGLQKSGDNLERWRLSFCLLFL